VLGGDEAEPSHEARGMGEASEIRGFGHDGVGDGLLDAAEREQRLGERIAVPVRRQGIQLALEPIAAALTFGDGIDELLEDDLLWGACEYESESQRR